MGNNESLQILRIGIFSILLTVIGLVFNIELLTVIALIPAGLATSLGLIMVALN